MQEWNYKSLSESSSGYEDVMDKLKSYKPEKYLKADQKEKEEMIEQIFQIYRNKNIYK